MLKHGRAGVPMEVMGLMLGEFIDDYTAPCCVPVVSIWPRGTVCAKSDASALGQCQSNGTKTLEVLLSSEQHCEACWPREACWPCTMFGQEEQHHMNMLRCVDLLLSQT